MANTADYLFFVPDALNEKEIEYIKGKEEKGWNEASLKTLENSLYQYISAYERKCGLFNDVLELKDCYFGGEAKELHYDSGMVDKEIYSPVQMVIMLSDLSERVGGLLRFPKQYSAYNFNKGDLLIFPSNFLFPHEVESFRGIRKGAYPHWVAKNRYN